MSEPALDAAPLRAALRSHARTLQLMGVDFLPIAPGAPASFTPPAPVSTHTTAPRPVPAVPVATPAPRPSAAAPASGDTDRDHAAALLERLRERYEHDAPHKQFVTAHNRIVFGEGDPRARLMFIGEAPGAEEDKIGRPFVGRAGQLLDKMIAAMGLERPSVYITNVLKTRPPNNATPTSEEAALCAPYLFEQIAIIRPEAIVALGLPATRTLLTTLDSMGRLRGRWHAFDPSLITLGLADPIADPVPVMPTYHPAFLLRAYTTDNRQKVWSDLQLVATRLGLAPAKGGPAHTA